MDSLSNLQNSIANIFILAHEIGHHFNNHVIDELVKKIQGGSLIDAQTSENKINQELEADQFAGAVMQRLGFDIAEVKDVILLLSSKSKNYKSYHPPASLRVIAAEKGYEKVKIQADAYAIDKVSNDFYYSGLNNFKLDKYGESIDDLNTYIKIEKRNERIDSLKLAESLGVVVVSKSLLEDSII